MNTERRESKRDSWVTETEAHRKSVQEFLQIHLSQPVDAPNRVSYDHIRDLHFSGQSRATMKKIASGEIYPAEVKVLYGSDDKPTQIYAWFDSEGSGHNIDVYLSNNALVDYLKTLPN